MTTPHLPLADLVSRASSLSDGGRVILGITGAPGSGKSTLAERLVASLGHDRGRLVGMDGYHLSEAELHRLGRRDRKGAPDTFDAAGYVALMRRLRSNTEEVVYAPLFDRSLEEAIAGSVPIPKEVPIVVTEGNYLLSDDGPWSRVADLLDECWYVETDEQMRMIRLIQRHISFGRSSQQAEERSYGSDQRNAEYIAGSRDRADLIVDFSLD